MITVVFGLIIVIGLLFIYFLPSIIATGKPNSDAILVLNLFLGWTFVGWVIALMIAVSPSEKKI